MRLWSRLRSSARAILQRSRCDSDMAAELDFHIEAYAEDLVRSGMARAEALRRARSEFGGAEQVKEECREARGLPLLETFIRDVRYGLRTLRKAPGFTVVAVFTITLGIGANTAIFSVLDGVLLRPLPYRDAEELVSVDVTPLALDRSARGIAPEDYFVFREQSRTFEGIGIYAETDTDRDVNVTGLAEPERVHALHATHEVLSVLGVAPAFGRIFSASDNAPGAPLTVVLSYGYALHKFGSGPSAIGKNMMIDGKACQIIGVLPSEFRFFAAPDAALILPVQLDRSRIQLGNFSYFGVARLKPGSTLAQATGEIARLLPIALQAFPPPPGFSVDSFKNARIAPSLLPLKQEVIGDIATRLWVLMGGVGMVLLIACANVANLLLVRTDGRQRELAVRSALGAGRRRIAVLLFAESAILGSVGAIFGLALAWLALRVLVSLAPAGLPRVAEIGIDFRVLLFTLTVALLTTALFGLIPVLKQARSQPVLTAAARTSSESRERHRTRNFLLALQVALALMLLICSGLMLRTLRALTQVDPGFSRHAELQTFRISIPAMDVRDDAGVLRMAQQINEKLGAIPGVSSAAFSSAVPLDGDNTLDNVYAADRVYAEGTIPPLRHLLFISPGYLHTLGIPLVAGRDLSWSDIYARVPVALISANFAREYWRTPSGALGKRIRISAIDDWRQVIGVVGDVHDESMDRPARSDVYWPPLLENFQGQHLHVTRRATFTVRSSLAGSEQLISRIRRTVWSVDPNSPVASVRTLNDLYAGSMARASFTLVMLGIAAGMALLLGSVGLYGAVAYSVSQRIREIGIRVALGSPKSDVMRRISGQAISVILIGLAAGFLASLGLTRLLSSLLFGVAATDPLTYAAVMILLSLVALAACYVPARRALRLDPLAALRHE